MKPNADICSEIQAQLPLYVGGDLEAGFAEAGSVAGSASGSVSGSAEGVSIGIAASGRDQLSRSDHLRRHVDACSACKAEFERLSVACAALASLRDERVAPIDVWDAVRAELASAQLFASTAKTSTATVEHAPVLAMPWLRRTSFRSTRKAAAALLAIGLAAAAWTWSRPSVDHDGAAQPGFVVSQPGVNTLGAEVAAHTATGDGTGDGSAHETSSDHLNLAVADECGLQRVDDSRGISLDWRDPRFGAPPFNPASINPASMNHASMNQQAGVAGRRTNPMQAVSNPVLLDPRVR